jgi:hypothetical protein
MSPATTLTTTITTITTITKSEQEEAMNAVPQYLKAFGYPLLGALVTLGVAASPARAQDAQTHASHSAGNQRPSGDLVDVVRRSTARFRDYKAAEKANYSSQFGCVSGSEFGAMGMHFVNFPLVFDGQIDATTPEIVIEPLRPARLLHAARLGLEGKPDGHFRQLARQRVVRRLQRPGSIESR